MLLVTFGVANLCAKIEPHPYFTGLEALNNWLEKFNKEHVKNVRKLFCKTIIWNLIMNSLIKLKVPQWEEFRTNSWNFANEVFWNQTQ